MVYQWSLSDSKSTQVSKTLVSILVDLNNGVVLLVSVSSSISNYFCPLTKRFGTVPSGLITICIIDSVIFHSFLGSLEKTKSLSLFYFSLIISLYSAGIVKSTIHYIFYFFHFLFFIYLFIFANYHLTWSSGRH